MRCAIVSDVHGNLPALEAVLTHARGLDALDDVWALGDLTGYGPQPDECIAALADHHARGILGNVDALILGRLALNPRRVPAHVAASVVWCTEHVSEASKAYLRRLPETRVVGQQHAFFLCHNAPVDTFGHPGPGEEPRPFSVLTAGAATPDALAANFERLRAAGHQYCLVGHRHLPVVFEAATAGATTTTPEDGGSHRLDAARVIANPGSVGVPRDGDWRAAYMVYDSGASLAAPTLTVHRVAYDLARLGAALDAVDHPLMTGPVKAKLFEMFSTGREVA